MDETLFKIVEYVVLAVILVVARYVIPMLRAKINTDKYQLLKDYAEKCINAAEKLISGTGAEKKEFVTDLLQQWAKKTGFQITDEQISILIEGIFAELDGYTVNTYKKEQTAKTE